jgi:hypothetical protein
VLSLYSINDSFPIFLFCTNEIRWQRYKDTVKRAEKYLYLPDKELKILLGGKEHAKSISLRGRESRCVRGYDIVRWWASFGEIERRGITILCEIFNGSVKTPWGYWSLHTTDSGARKWAT